MSQRSNTARAQIARGFSLPPPIGGLNARDALSNMDPRDALILDNFFPRPTNIEMRRGNESYATGLGAPVETLMEWSGPMGAFLFGAAGTNIYDVTTAGAVGAAKVTGLNSARWQYINFATAGGNFIWLANGADSVRTFDGTTWAVPVITGATSSTLIYPWAHKSRIWAVQKNTLDAWYLPTASIAGLAVKFPLGSIFQLGGNLIAIGTLSQDSGAGPDDYLIFLTNNGEIAAYQGTDPADPDAWALVGVYQISRPVPLRPMLKVGGDMIVITDEGAISLIKAINVDKSALVRAAISDKIATLFNTTVRTYKDNFGWMAITYPRGNMVLFNVPLSENEMQAQFVMNTDTLAWCTFSNLNANCWEQLGDDIFFGGNDGTVYQFDSSFEDNGEAILGRIKTSFNYYGNRGANKYVVMGRPIYRSNGSPSISFDIDMDFGNSDPGSNLDIPAVGAGWGVGLWGNALWSGTTNYVTGWRTLGGIGYCGAIRMNVLVKGQSMEINAFDIQAQVGGPI